MSNDEKRELRGWLLLIARRAAPYGASFRVIEIVCGVKSFCLCHLTSPIPMPASVLP